MKNSDEPNFWIRLNDSIYQPVWDGKDKSDPRYVIAVIGVVGILMMKGLGIFAAILLGLAVLVV